MIRCSQGERKNAKNAKNAKTLLFLTFSVQVLVLIANPRQALYMVANPARGLLNSRRTNPLCAAAASCVTEDLPISPRLSPTIFYRGCVFNTPMIHLCTAVPLYAQNPVLEIV